MAAPTIQARFAEQVARTPDATAVLEDASRASMTYQELEKRACQLAHRLVRLGVGREDRVAVLVTRSAELVVAFLATLKAGASFVPVHDAYPADRRQWVVDHAGAAVLLVDAAMRTTGVPAGVPIVDVGDPSIAGELATDPGVPVHLDQLAYVIHTSGSTGRPKGVGVTNGEVVRLLSDPQWVVARHERRLLVLPHAFDIAVFEIWMPLVHGGLLVLGPPGQLDGATLRRLITDHRITGMHLTAGLFRVIAEDAPETFAGLGEIVTGGDVIASTAVNRVIEACPDVVVLATYGATEGTVMSTQVPLTRGAEVGAFVPLGDALTGVAVRLLTERLSPTPVGQVGELYLADAGVARGYLGQPALTAQRFVADPYGGPGARMYRTGDLARRTADGAIEFVGREDSQVKVHGFLVEPAEVEAALAGFPGLAQLVVVARELGHGDKQLLGYVVPEPGGLDLTALRVHARTKLPEYMVPALFVEMASLPLTANGKLDRPALPAPRLDRMSAHRAPATPLQRTLCGIFGAVLDLPEVGVHDNFFELGGQSLQAVLLTNQVRVEIGTDLLIDVVFDCPTVAELAAYIRATQGAPA